MSRLIRAVREVLDAWNEEDDGVLPEAMQELAVQYQINLSRQTERQRQSRQRRRAEADTISDR